MKNPNSKQFSHRDRPGFASWARSSPSLPKPILCGLCVLCGIWFFSASSAQAEEVLHLYNWNNYISEETVARFESQCACRVVQDYYSDNEEMLAKLAAGAIGYDIIVPTGNAMESLIRQHALRPLDKRLLPNLKNIAPAYLDAAFDPGNRYSIPYAYTLTLIGYNSEKIRELGLPTDSWAVIFEPRYLEKIKGRVTVLDSQRELLAAALKYLGYSANDTDEAHWKQARDLIIRAKPYWAAFNASSYIKELTVGNIWLVHGYSNDIFQADLDAQKAGRKFRILSSIPREGAVLSMDSMVLHKTGPRPDLAHRFINFMLEGKNSAELTNLIGSGNPNRDALQYINPEIANNPAVFPNAAQQTRLEMLRDLDRQQRRVLSRIWTKIKLR
ncbi:MAG: spermidine/putrescine ABC transporter substrate-binding protein [Nitrosomonadales bacterium]|nr:spermidine/putrescine ABC transporter substrate-binding protein [Nitrosomonadales bacterium]